MKRYCFVLIAFFISVSAFSQKVKIKNDIISLDDVQVGKVEKYKDKETKEDGYVFSDLEGKNKLTLAKYDFGPGSLWLALRANFVKDTAEIKMEYLSFTLKEQNALTELLVKKYHFFDEQGMNVDAITKYVKTEQTPQIPILAEQVSAKKKLREDMSKLPVKVLDNGTIVKVQGFKEDIIGRFVAPAHGSQVSNDNPLIIKDEHGNIIAWITGFPDKKKSNVITFDDQNFIFETILPYDGDFAGLYYRDVARYMVMNEYMKDQPNSYVNQMKAAEIREAALAREEQLEYKKRIDVTGVLYLKNGEKYTGRFLAEFRQTENGSVQGFEYVKRTKGMDGKSIYYLQRDDRFANPDTIHISSFDCLGFEVDTRFSSSGEKEIYDVISYSLYDPSIHRSAAISEAFVLRKIVTPVIGLYYSSGYYILKRPEKKTGISRNKFVKVNFKDLSDENSYVLEKIDKGYYQNGYEGLYEFVEDCSKER